MYVTYIYIYTHTHTHDTYIFAYRYIENNNTGNICQGKYKLGNKK